MSAHRRLNVGGPAHRSFNVGEVRNDQQGQSNIVILHYDTGSHLAVILKQVYSGFGQQTRRWRELATRAK